MAFFNCSAENDNEQRTKDLAKIADATLEERIKRLEEWVYDYEPSYCPPPRFF